MTPVKFMTKEELEAGLDHIRMSPDDEGVIEMIVCRPETDQRRILDEGTIDLRDGLLGDKWSGKSPSGNRDVSDRLDRQITIMNARSVALMAVSRDRWPLAGDQIYVDMNIGVDNLPAGTRLALGTAIVEVTDRPHNGCKKFRERYGLEALKFVNSPSGKKLHLRGINTRVVRPGKVRQGDRLKKITGVQS